MASSEAPSGIESGVGLAQGAQSVDVSLSKALTAPDELAVALHG